MGFYRRKPVVLEAMQWDGTVASATAVIDWVLTSGGTIRYHDESELPALAVDAIGGTVTAQAGDWIMRGVKGEFYPCQPDIFEATYEPAEAPVAT